MSGRNARKLLQARYRRALFQPAAAGQMCDLSRPALVFSPHFDDETLGCGGTLIRKRQAGAAVRIVFMTDGSQSHAQRISRPALCAMRAAEALAAAATLGVDADSVSCLGIAETRLADDPEPVIGEILRLLQAHRPEEIYLPHRREPQLWSQDHRATTQFVLDAVRRWGRQVILYEYPIWFWFHWPWVAVPLHARSNRREIVKNSLSELFGWRAQRELTCAVEVRQVLGQKRAALDQYRSQMFRPESDPNWTVLGDVAGGEFLDCFFQPFEVFRKAVYTPASGTPAAAGTQ